MAIRTLILYPEVAFRDCRDCVKWLYDDKPARMGARLERPKGYPVPRIPGQRPRCEWCPKVPVGEAPDPSNAVELSPKNSSAYRHYLECAAVGDFPPDPIVRRNAMIIRQVEKFEEECRQDESQQRGVLLGLQLLNRG